jgi:hypothetical protein
LPKNLSLSSPSLTISPPLAALVGFSHQHARFGNGPRYHLIPDAPWIDLNHNHVRLPGWLLRSPTNRYDGEYQATGNDDRVTDVDRTIHPAAEPTTKHKHPFFSRAPVMATHTMTIIQDRTLLARIPLTPSTNPTLAVTQIDYLKPIISMPTTLATAQARARCLNSLTLQVLPTHTSDQTLPRHGDRDKTRTLATSSAIRLAKLSLFRGAS